MNQYAGGDHIQDRNLKKMLSQKKLKESDNFFCLIEQLTMYRVKDFNVLIHSRTQFLLGHERFSPAPCFLVNFDT